MPVYYRSDVAMTPASIHNVIPEDDDDYIQDPDQLKALLPQPFRLVDKILNGVIDDAWDIIQNRENKRIADSSKIRPPQYECGIQMQTFGNSLSMVDSKDGKYIFLGQPDGVAVIDASNQQTVTVWEDQSAAITSIHVTLLSDETYLLSTVDENGNVRLLGLNNGKLFLLQTMNEKDSESSSGKVVTRCEASFDGEYVGMSMKNPETSSCIMDVYKLPKDAWLKDIMSIHNQSVKKQSRLESPQMRTETEDAENAGNEDNLSEAAVGSVKPQEEVNEERSEGAKIGTFKASKKKTSPCKKAGYVPSKNKVIATVKTQKISNQMCGYDKSVQNMTPGSAVSSRLSSRSRSRSSASYGSKSSQSFNLGSSATSSSVRYSGGKLLTTKRSPGSQRVASASGDRSSHKFTPGHIVLKVKSPEPLTGIQITSPYAASKGITQGEVIGTGANHIITSHHLEQREATFNHAHSHLARYLSKESQETMEPNFHFLTAGRMLPHGLEQAALHELEHKAEMVWPFAGRIAATAVSPCTNLVAVALHNGNMVIWDKYLGLQRKILNITKKANITSLEFLDPRLTPQDGGNYPPYKTSTAGYVMVTCDDGSIMLVNCGQGDRSGPSMASPELESEDEMYSKIMTIPGIPQLIITCRQNGCVYIQDLLRGNVLCQITLPADHTLFTPLKPVMAVGGSGDMLYMKAEYTATAESRPPSESGSSIAEEVVEEAEFLFVFQLRSFPSLDKYRQDDTPPMSYTVHTMINERIDALLKERMTQQVLRKPRMQERWSNLKNDLEMIKQIREKRPPLGRKAFTQSSIARTPILPTKKTNRQKGAKTT